MTDLTDAAMERERLALVAARNRAPRHGKRGWDIRLQAHVAATLKRENER